MQDRFPPNSHAAAFGAEGHDFNTLSRQECIYVIVPSLTGWPPTYTVWAVSPAGEMNDSALRAWEHGVHIGTELDDSCNIVSVWKAVSSLRQSGLVIITCEEPLLMSATGVVNLAIQKSVAVAGFPSVAETSTFRDPCNLWSFVAADPCDAVAEANGPVKMLCGIVEAVSDATGRHFALSGPAIFCSNSEVLMPEPCVINLRISSSDEILAAQRHIGDILAKFKDAYEVAERVPKTLDSAAAIAEAWQVLLDLSELSEEHAKVLWVNLRMNMIVVRAPRGFASALAYFLSPG